MDGIPSSAVVGSGLEAFGGALQDIGELSEARFAAQRRNDLLMATLGTRTQGSEVDELGNPISPMLPVPFR